MKRLLSIAIAASMMLIGTSLQAQNAAADYERQIVGTYAKKDMKTLDRLLAAHMECLPSLVPGAAWAPGLVPFSSGARTSRASFG